MKKTVAALLMVLLCMGLWSCAKQEPSPEEAVSAPTQSQTHPENTEPSEPGGEAQTQYSETQSPTDGSWAEIRRNEEGTLVSIHDNPETGEHIEMEFFDNFKLKRSASYNPKIDRYSEVEFYENGNEKWASVREPSTGFTSEQEYYENGNRKYIKTRSPKEAREMQYNEDGYCTYSYSAAYRKDGSLSGEVECFADETGKLTKVIKDGEEIKDEKFLSDRIREFGFRE